MSLYKKFQLLDVLRDDGVKSFQALELASGRPVQVHLIMGQPGRSSPPYELLDQLKQFSAENLAQVIETGEHSGTPYVVTLPLEGFSGFRDWIAAKAASAGVEPPPPRDSSPLSRVGRWKVPSMVNQAPPVPLPADDSTLPFSRLQDGTPLEKTRLFGPPAAMPQSPPAAPPPAAPPPAASKPGEFTSMFQSPVQPQSEAEPVFGQPVMREPDDFARMFGAASEPASPAPPLSPPPAQELGEFTRMFNAANPAPPQAAPPAPPPVVSSPAAPAASSAGPGEFTRMFNAANPAPPQAAPPAPPPVASSPAAPAASAAGPGEFTRMFNAANPAPPQAGPPAPPPVASSPPPAPSPSGPGEFTRMFNAANPAPPQAAPPAPPPGASAPPPAPSPAAPGEFTRMFNASPPVESTLRMPTATPAQPPQSVPGEVTRLFQTPPQPSSSPPPLAAPASPAVSQQPPPAGAGGFTAMFQASPAPVSNQAKDEHGRLFDPPPQDSPSFMRGGSPALGSVVPPSPFASQLPLTPADRGASAKPVDEYERLFGSGNSPQPPPGPAFSQPLGLTGAFSTPAPGALPSGTAPGPGPSEFTRLIGTIPPPAPPAVSPPAVQPPLSVPAPPKRAVWPLVLLGVIAVLLVAGLIVTLVRN